MKLIQKTEFTCNVPHNVTSIDFGWPYLYA